MRKIWIYRNKYEIYMIYMFLKIKTINKKILKNHKYDVWFNYKDQNENIKLKLQI